MARIRTVKPQFFTNEKLCELSPATHLLAAGLLTVADDEGYFNANPKLIAAAIFPLRDSLKVQVMLTELEGIDWLRLGTGADGRVYGYVVNFKDHQRINRPTPSKIKTLTITWSTQPQLTEGSVPEGNKEGNKEEGGRRAADFAEFWKAYPRKEARDRAQDWWKAHKPDQETLTAMLGAIEWQRREGCLRFATADGRSLIPLPASWLNAGRWKDERQSGPPEPVTRQITPCVVPGCKGEGVPLHGGMCQVHRMQSKPLSAAQMAAGIT